MRKTSQDGGDSTSITSGFDNEFKKSGVGLIKTKRNSIKKKVQNFSHESDDTVNEPLLQMEKIESANRSGTFLLSKSKVDSVSDRESHIYSDKSSGKSSVSSSKSKVVSPMGPPKTSSLIPGPLHNHMNTNVFGGHDGSKMMIPVKSPVLVEINASKSTGYSPTPLIFTTARIHTDSKTKNMEPVQVTTVPILSTIEGNIIKAGVITHSGQPAATIPITSSNVIIPGTSQIASEQHIDTSQSSMSGIGKSDPKKCSNQNMFSKLTDSLDSRPTIPSIESESRVLKKSYDTKDISVTLSSTPGKNEIEKPSKIATSEQLKSKAEKYEKPTTEPQSSKKSEEKTVENVNMHEKKADLKQSIDNERTLNLKKTVTSVSHPSTSKPLKEMVNKEDSHKTISVGSGNNKFLQRQKNTVVEDITESDTHGKKVSAAPLSRDISDNVASTSQPQFPPQASIDADSKNITPTTTASNTNTIKNSNKSSADKDDTNIKKSSTDTKVMQPNIVSKSETFTEKKSTLTHGSKSVIEKSPTINQSKIQKANVTSVPKSIVKSANGSIAGEATQTQKTGAANKQTPVTSLTSRPISESQNIISSSLDKSCKPQVTSNPKVGTSETTVSTTSSIPATKTAKTNQETVIASKSAKSETVPPVIQSSTSDTKLQSSAKVSPSSITATPNVKSSTSAKSTSLASKSKGTMPKDKKSMSDVK